MTRVLPATPPGLAAPPPRTVRALGPGGALALAAATVAGAVVARPLSLLVPAAVVVFALVLRRPWPLLVAATLASSALGARAEAGLAPPERASVDAVVTLVTDPEARWGRVEAIARLDGRLVLLQADGSAADVVAPRLAGEDVRVAGRLGPPPGSAPWLRVRHVSGALAARHAERAGSGAAPWRVANRLRRTLSDGAAHLGDDQRSLYLGLVLGDDRDQPLSMTDDFRGSGLSHLLAVSGQNVAFVLALALPLLRRLSITGRAAAVLVLLGLFVVVTRAEPSVLRAVAMAGAAALAAAWGRPTPALQLLGLAVAGCVLVDPFLVGSIGFHLSVAATAGILVLGPRLTAALPGPPALVAPLAVSAAAQLGVAPLIVAGFDGVPVASLPANLLAAPAAALVTTWGLPAGIVAGVVGPPVDGLAHQPTALALAWVAGVARTASSVPLGQMGAGHVALSLLAVVAVVVAHGRGQGRRWPRVLRVTAAVAVVVALVQPGAALRSSPLLASPSGGVDVWRAGGATVVLVAPGTGPRSVLEGLRLGGVSRIDLLVVGGGASAGDEERAARYRARVSSVWWRGRSPPLRSRLGGLVVAAAGDEAHVAPVDAR